MIEMPRWMGRLLSAAALALSLGVQAAPVVSLPPGSSVDEAMRLMTDRRIRHLPVVESGRVLGVVSIGDLVKSVIEEQRHTIDDLHSYIRG